MDVGSIAARAVCCVLLPHRAASRSYPEGIPNETATVPSPNLVPLLSAERMQRDATPTKFAPFLMPEGSRCGVLTVSKKA